MRVSISRSASPRQYAPASLVNLNAPSLPVEGRCGPRHRSVNLPMVYVVMTASSGSSAMSSSLNGWLAKISSASARVTTRRSKASSAFTISAMRASMAAKSSGDSARSSFTS